MVTIMPTLYIIATPIGNIEDISLRALRIFKEIDHLACEDTRITRKLFSKYDIILPKNMFSYHEHNEQHAGNKIISLLQNNIDVALCSDCGCPLISDPGYRIVSEVLELEFQVEVIPGPCAIETALMSSGMPTSSFTFLGFAPPKSGKRINSFIKEANSPHTLIYYESPHRIGKFLTDAKEIYGNRIIAVCIELTKKFQSIHKGWLFDICDEFQNKKIKGEIVVVISGNNPKFIKGDQ